MEDSEGSMLVSHECTVNLRPFARAQRLSQMFVSQSVWVDSNLHFIYWCFSMVWEVWK